MNIFNTNTHLRTKDLEQLITSENSCVEVMEQERDLRTMPYHGNNFATAAKEQLNALIGKYDRDLYGIVLGFKNIKMLAHYALIDDDGLNNFPIRADFFVFKPIIGKKLPAIVTKKSKDHVGCLVYDTFNMSIPKPEGVENWTGNNVEIGQEVVAQVTYVKLDSRIPYIRGEFPEKLKVNRKIKFTDANETIQDKINEDDMKDTVDCEHSSKKKKKSRRSLENVVEILDESIEIRDNCSKKVKIKSDCNLEDELGKKKKKSRKSQEIQIDEITFDGVDILEDGSVKKKKSRKNIENDIDKITSNESTEMKSKCDDEANNESVCDMKNVLLGKNESGESLEHYDEDMKSKRKSKKRRNSTITEDVGKTKKRKVA